MTEEIIGSQNLRVGRKLGLAQGILTQKFIYVHYISVLMCPPLFFKEKPLTNLSNDERLALSIFSSLIFQDADSPLTPLPI